MFSRTCKHHLIDFSHAFIHHSSGNIDTTGHIGPVHTSRLKSSFGARILMPKCPSTEPGVHTEQALRIRPQTSQSAAVQGRLRSHRKLMIYRCRAYFPLSRGGLKVISSPESRSRLAFRNHVLNGVFIRFLIGECRTWPLFLPRGPLKLHSDVSNRLQLDSVPGPYIYLLP